MWYYDKSCYDAHFNVWTEASKTWRHKRFNFRHTRTLNPSACAQTSERFFETLLSVLFTQFKVLQNFQQYKLLPSIRITLESILILLNSDVETLESVNEKRCVDVFRKKQNFGYFLTYSWRQDGHFQVVIKPLQGQAVCRAKTVRKLQQRRRRRQRERQKKQ